MVVRGALRWMAVVMLVVGVVSAAAEEPAKTKRLFNGQDLTDWRIADQHDFARHGEVTVDQGQIIMRSGQPATGIVYAEQVPRSNYELTLEAKRLEGSDFFCGLTFPVGPEYCTLIVGGWGGGVIGLSNIDGMSAVENRTTNYLEFHDDRWYPIRLRVTDSRIEAWIDAKQLVDLERAERKFSIWWEQEPMRPLGIATWNTAAALRKVQLEQLPAAEK